jgi:hypothetical protein
VHNSDVPSFAGWGQKILLMSLAPPRPLPVTKRKLAHVAKLALTNVRFWG